MRSLYALLGQLHPTTVRAYRTRLILNDEAVINSNWQMLKYSGNQLSAYHIYMSQTIYSAAQ